MTVDNSTGDIIVARDDFISYYESDGRGPYFAYDGPKSLVAIYEDYVAVVSPPATTSAAKSSTLRKFGGAQADDIFSTSTFTMVDPGMKIVAHSESLVSQVQSIFMIWGDLFTLTQDGKVGNAEIEFEPLLTFDTDISISSEVSSTKTRDPLSKKSLCLCHQSSAEIRHGCSATECNLQKIR
jgi:hypothetical protein